MDCVSLAIYTSKEWIVYPYLDKVAKNDSYVSLLRYSSKEWIVYI